MKQRLYSICLFLLAIITALCTGYSASAVMDDAMLDFFYQNGIYYYNPDGQACDPEDIPGNVSPKPVGTDITWIGDSYTVGITTEYDIMSQKLTGVDVHAKTSKHFVQDATDNDSGMTILSQIKNNLRKYVVFALGANDPDGANSIKEAIKTIKSDYMKDDRYFIFVTARTKKHTYSEVNKVLRDAADGDDHIIVADWAKASKDKLDDYFATNGDGVHPNKKGYQAWFDVIYNALPGGVNLVDGDSNEARIWNYFVNANIPGVSDNAAVIAGIMGNLQQESSFNPFQITSIYYGLFQTDRADFRALIEQEVGNYWTPSATSNAPKEKIQKAIDLELDYLINKYPRFGIATPKDEPTFMDSLTVVSEPKPGPYAELFEVLAERAVTNDSSDQNKILDPGVLKLSTKKFANNSGGGKYYQHVQQRRNYAKAIYKDFTSNPKSNTPSTQPTNSTTPISGNTILSKQQEQFVIDHYQIAQKLSVAYGIPWETVVAQGILESASGTSRLAKDKHNYFGIGAFDSCPYECAKSYENEEAGWAGYYENIRITATYRNHGVFSGATVTDPYAYLAAIKAAGYATSPDYVQNVSKLIAAIEQLSIQNTWNSSAELARNNPGMLEAAARYAASAGTIPTNISDPNTLACVDPGNGGRSPYDSSDFPHYEQCNAGTWPNGNGLGLPDVTDCGDNGCFTGPAGWKGASCTACWTDCGPFSFAMMATYLTKTVVDPQVVAQEASEMSLLNCSEGANHLITAKMAQKYGLEYKNISASSVSQAIKNINEALQDGWMIHVTGGIRGVTGINPFFGRHYIGIISSETDSQGNTKWHIADSGRHDNTPDKTWDPDYLFNQAHMDIDNIHAIKPQN